MKKIISTLAFVLGVVALSFAQEAHETATSKGAEALADSKSSGEYVFTLPQGTTSETVEANANYYTNTFDVVFDENSKEASIVMKSNEVKDRYVIVRFLTACNIRYVQVGDETLELYDFIDKYLK